MHCSRLLITPKKIVLARGIELGYSRMATSNADHSVTRNSMKPKKYNLRSSSVHPMDDAHVHFY